METNYAKCGCDQCGGHIEFPMEAAGLSVSCPHCGGTTVLNLPTVSAPQKRSAKKWIVVLGFILATLTFVVFKFLFPGTMPRGISAKVLSFERASAGNPGAVSGIVENRSARQPKGVRVEIELLNARGEPLWSTTAFAPGIKPKTSWQFRASVVDPNVMTARVARVRELRR